MIVKKVSVCEGVMGEGLGIYSQNMYFLNIFSFLQLLTAYNNSSTAVVEAFRQLFVGVVDRKRGVLKAFDRFCEYWPRYLLSFFGKTDAMEVESHALSETY